VVGKRSVKFVIKTSTDEEIVIIWKCKELRGVYAYVRSEETSQAQNQPGEVFELALSLMSVQKFCQ
jgi:hypothetical protein